MAHSITRDNHLYNPYASNLPIDARSGTNQFQVTGYIHHQNSFAPSSVPDSIDAASARLLSIRYGFDPNDPILSAVQLPIADDDNIVRPSSLAPKPSQHFCKRPVLYQPADVSIDRYWSSRVVNGYAFSRTQSARGF